MCCLAEHSTRPRQRRPCSAWGPSRAQTGPPSKPQLPTPAPKPIKKGENIKPSVALRSNQTSAPQRSSSSGRRRRRESPHAHRASRSIHARLRKSRPKFPRSLSSPDDDDVSRRALPSGRDLLLLLRPRRRHPRLRRIRRGRGSGSFPCRFVGARGIVWIGIGRRRVRRRAKLSRTLLSVTGGLILCLWFAGESVSGQVEEAERREVGLLRNRGNGTASRALLDWFLSVLQWSWR